MRFPYTLADPPHVVRPCPIHLYPFVGLSLLPTENNGTPPQYANLKSLLSMFLLVLLHERRGCLLSASWYCHHESHLTSQIPLRDRPHSLLPVPSTEGRPLSVTSIHRQPRKTSLDRGPIVPRPKPLYRSPYFPTVPSFSLWLCDPFVTRRSPHREDGSDRVPTRLYETRGSWCGSTLCPGG